MDFFFLFQSLVDVYHIPRADVNVTSPVDPARQQFAANPNRSIKNFRANNPVAILPGSSLVVRAVPHWQVPAEVVGEGEGRISL